VVADPIFSRGGDIAAWGSMMESVAIVMALYHVLAAIFASEGGGSEEEGEGWLAKRIREGGKAVTPEEKKKKEAEQADLGPIREKIGNLSTYVEAYENKAKDYMSRSTEYKQSTEVDMKDSLFEEMLELADDLRRIGEGVEITAADVTSDAKLFEKLEERDLVNIALIMRRYRFALTNVINSTAHAVN
jgi:uncharacterized protein YlxW (UPF0749 family)